MGDESGAKECKYKDYCTGDYYAFGGVESERGFMLIRKVEMRE